MNHATEMLLWFALCLQPSGVEVYDPFAAQHYRIDTHYNCAAWGTITYGIDCKVTGPGEEYDWVVLKYRKNAFAPLAPDSRTVSHHNRNGELKEPYIE